MVMTVISQTSGSFILPQARLFLLPTGDLHIDDPSSIYFMPLLPPKTGFAPSFVMYKELWIFMLYLLNLWIKYMSNTTQVLKEAGHAYHSRAPGFTFGFWRGPCCPSFQLSVLCCFLVFCLSCVVCAQYCQLLWIVHF